ncbi:MAG: transposase, partial [Proteobacteria bacterium]|nr:transposase [Pseudomonadota bacterium]
MLKGIKNKFFRFKQIFKDGLDKYLKHTKYDTPYIRDEVNKMLICGTEEGGFVEYGCSCCGKDKHRINMSCKGKCCPQCGKRYARDSMEKIANQMLSVISYRQVVLTLPSEYREHFRNHDDQSNIYAAFMKAAHLCIREVICKHFKSWNYDISCIVFIHTHGRNGIYNPHLHILLGEGAMELSNHDWKEFKYIDMNELRKTWQKRLLSMIRKNMPELNELSDALEAEHIDGFYANPGKVGEVPTEKTKGLIRYLTKYLASPPIGLSRITKYEDYKVSYYYKSHLTKRNEFENVSVDVFLDRMIPHILPKNFQRVRYYGLQATAKVKFWREVISQIVGVVIDSEKKILNRISYADFFEEITGRNPLKCRCCSEKMEVFRIV